MWGVIRIVTISVLRLSLGIRSSSFLPLAGGWGTGQRPEMRLAYSRGLCLPFVGANSVSLALPWAAGLARCVAPPLPSETASLGFAGGPIG